MPQPAADIHHSSPQDLFDDPNLLAASDLFDEAAYRVAARLDDDVNAAAHYIHEGWRSGLEPNAHFEGSFLYPYFQSIGFNGPPAVTFLTLRVAGWAVYPSHAHVEAVARVVDASGLFDADAYAAHLDQPHLSPLTHYILVGERMGYSPSERFDPVYYGKRYPDIPLAGTNYLLHYIEHGRQEGRRAISHAAALSFNRSRIDPSRKTVLLVVHQTTRTGAPILAYNIAMQLQPQYNLVALLLSGGDLLGDFERVCDAAVGPLDYADWHSVEAEYVVQRLVETYELSYAIVNSIDSRVVLKSLSCAHVPVVTLVHEFAAHLRVKGEMGRALEWSTATVFSAEAVLESVRSDYPNIDNWPVIVLPQGRCVLPPAGAQPQLAQAEQSLRETLRKFGQQRAFLVFGCGTIYLRKGVDLFISCAAAVGTLQPERPIFFIWIGRRLDPSIDGDYYPYLIEQIERAGLQDKVAILDEVSDLDSVFALIDVFFLSSRLDPLPNVAIDAAVHGKPVVCFDNASGMSDLLKHDPHTRLGVVPYVDVYAAAKAIVRFADDKALFRRVGAATKHVADQTFNMKNYVASIDDLGRIAADIMRQRSEDLSTIAADNLFDSTMFLGRDLPEMTREEAIRLFLARAAAIGTSKVPTANFYYRRPVAGFHPQIYAHANAARYNATAVNSLAHFIRSGKPTGLWTHEVITPPPLREASETKLRAALHVHFHYPELAREFLEKISANRSRCDLLISTNSETKASELRQTIADYRSGEIVIRVVPNRGRDIGPFLTAFADKIRDRYDVIGHVHSKRSVFTDAMLGETWREFLWQNLLGKLYPMMDLIFDRFAADEKLGLVFPEDPHLPDWDKNLEISQKLAQRMGIQLPLDPFFDFPVGTMFWARPDALRPMFELKLEWNDYPTEPVPIDGTILHSLERLVPFAARQTGYRFATTHIPGITW